MIAYTRTDNYSAERLKDAIAGVPIMVIKSKRSELVNVNYSMQEAIKYDLSILERHQSFSVPKYDKVVIVKEKDFPMVQAIVKRLLSNLKFRWTILNSMDRDLNEYAYRTRSKEIRFKLNLMRKERVFKHG